MTCCGIIPAPLAIPGIVICLPSRRGSVVSSDVGGRSAGYEGFCASGCDLAASPVACLFSALDSATREGELCLETRASRCSASRSLASNSCSSRSPELTVCFLICDQLSFYHEDWSSLSLLFNSLGQCFHLWTQTKHGVQIGSETLGDHAGRLHQLAARSAASFLSREPTRLVVGPSSSAAIPVPALLQT